MVYIHPEVYKLVRLVVLYGRLKKQELLRGETSSKEERDNATWIVVIVHRSVEPA